MLYRKIEPTICQHLSSNSDKILIVSGARQIGKSFIIRHVGTKLFHNFVEVNFIDDFNGDKLFQNVNNVDDFYFVLSSIAGEKLGSKKDTLIFLDEIQQYPQFLTMLKFLREDGRYKIIASGSLLGITLKSTASVPIGSIKIIHMYPLDFEEFLIANEVGKETINKLYNSFHDITPIPEGVHKRILSLYKRYILVGGMPEAVNAYLDSHNIAVVRQVQNDIHRLYGIDASQYDEEHKLKIMRLYDMIVSNMENVKKRLILKNIDNKKGARFTEYQNEMDYLISSGIALEVAAISNPRFPLSQSVKKNLIKLYLNDVGLLTGLLYHNNIQPILEDMNSINLGSVYECAVAQELTAGGHNLYYYDNKKQGEVDFLIDDYADLSIAPIEVKSGKDYRRHIALSRMVNTPDYHIKRGYVLSNSGIIEERDNIIYLPVYMAMFFDSTGATANESLILPEL